MPSQVLTSVENNFTKGLVTEFTGLNFPENAATDCDNVEFTIVGDVLRRYGIDLETNYAITSATTVNVAKNSYKWDNAGGDGNSQLIAVQSGTTVYFYSVTSATTTTPISASRIASTVTLTSFTAPGGFFDVTSACEFTDGNGYLFIFHPSCNPIFCSYSAGAITATGIDIQIRDFNGIFESGVNDNLRPSTLTTNHTYNLLNQGWTSGNSWAASSTTVNSIGTGAKVFTVAAGISGISGGQSVTCFGVQRYYPGGPIYTYGYLFGTVTSYAGSTLTLSISSTNDVGGSGSYGEWTIGPTSTGYVGTWFTAVGNYPSNADQWWRFKNTSNVFDPATTQANTSVGLGSAPKGHYILSAFNQTRTAASGVSGLTDITTTLRPTNGCWFQGRIWYTGVNSSFPASGTAQYTTWTENIYFSQVVNKIDDFSRCYQTNDPTAEDLNSLLPTDGGVIVIQGSGAIYKLFPIQNGLLVFAANGVWFITGSQGIGFAANDYTITKISNIQSISTTSFVNVMGLPYFWNEEGIYQVKPSQSGSLTVESVTVGTILTYYEEIPIESKKFVRGAYHPIDYTIQWVYRSTNSTDTTTKYTFDKALNFNVFNKAFYPYTFDTTVGYVSCINYVAGPGGATTIPPGFKYLTIVTSDLSFADIHDTTYVDWASQGDGIDFESYFVTGYKLHGQAQRRFQIPYLYVYSRNNNEEQSYKIQSRWDFTTSGNSGRWSSQQLTYIDSVYQSTVFKRHRLRGHGLVLQIKITSVSGEPFDIIGWSAYEAQNTSV